MGSQVKLDDITVYKNEENIIVTQLALSKDGNIDVYKAQKIAEAMLELSGGKPHLFMTSAMDTKFYMSAGARDYLLYHPELKKLRLKEAFVSNHLGMKIPAKVVSKMAKTNHEIEVFSSEEKALKWLTSDSSYKKGCCKN